MHGGQRTMEVMRMVFVMIRLVSGAERKEASESKAQ